MLKGWDLTDLGKPGANPFIDVAPLTNSACRMPSAQTPIFSVD